MVYRTPGKPMLKNYEYRLSRAEVVEAISLWLQNERGEVTLPCDNYSHVSVIVQDNNYDEVPVMDGRPLIVKWDQIDGEEP